MVKLTPKLEVILSVIAYSFCSGSLVLINKLILHLLPYPSLVIVVQLLFSVFIIYAFKILRILTVDPIKWNCVRPYLIYTVAFAVGVYCNMRSLSTSNVETVIVARSMAPLVVSIADAMFLGREYPSIRSWFSLIIIVAGAVGYAITDEEFKTLGMEAYSWPIMYVFAISFEMAFGKKIIRDVDLKTLSGPVLYTNLFGWPPMLAFAAIAGEYDSFWSDLWGKFDGHLPKGSIPFMVAGCIVGTGIGYSGWWCRDKISATTFTLVGVMNKCLTVLVNLLIWDNHASPEGCACLFVCLIGGSLYRQAPLRRTIEKSLPEDVEEQKPLTTEQEAHKN